MHFTERLHSSGVQTGRDAWCYNPSQLLLEENMERTIEFYNSEQTRWAETKFGKTKPAKTRAFLNEDPKRISWTSSLVAAIRRGKTGYFRSDATAISVYRPFTKQWLYFDKMFNHRVSKMPRIFPNAELPNRVIAVTGRGEKGGFSALMMDTLPNHHAIKSGQSFPFYLYEEVSLQNGFLDGTEEQSGYHHREAITEGGLAYFRAAYPGETITRKDVFYYLYGLLHSEEYRGQFRNNLFRELPRIPLAKRAKDFWAFRDAGHELGKLHVGYESVPPLYLFF